MSDHYFARQPILDREQQLFAYELLYRGDLLKNSAEIEDGDAATADVMVSSLVDSGLDDVVGSYPALINVTTAFLEGRLALPEKKDSLIFEILEDVKPTPKVIDAILELAEEGYRLALDDYEHRPEFKPILEVVELVKLDIRALSSSELSRHVAILQGYDCRLLGEKVETREEYALCRDLGFSYFQGYFFSRPQQMSVQRSSVNRTSALRLVTRLQDSNCGFDEIQELIVNDAALSVRLLKFVNSPFCGLSHEVHSLREALAMVGLRLVRRWATLLLMERLGEGQSPELINLALTRGKMCELLGEHCDEHDTSEYFTVGLFSVLDVLLGQPLETAVASLPLGPHIKTAIQHKTGPLGQSIADVIAFEKNPQRAQSEIVAAAHVEAIIWTQKFSQLS